MDDETVLTDMAALLGDDEATVAGRYQLQGVLGTGGLAVVHEATDTRLDRQVAVKVLRDPATSQADRARFISEARLLGGLSHPHLVRVLDAGVDRDLPYLVLELVRGTTLADVLDRPLPPDRAARLGVELASALDHVHRAGIVHRDVKPGNVLLDEHGAARLADFGIARLVDDTSRQTRTGNVVGTVAYLAPEQVAGERVTTAADIYSLGLLLLEALTGTRPYAGSSVECAFARLHRPPVLPSSLPARWRSLLASMTARDPAARPTAAAVATSLQADEPAPERRELGPRIALVGATLAFVLLLGTAAWSSLPLPTGSPSAAVAHRGAIRDPMPAATASAASVGVPAATAVAPPAPVAQPVQEAATQPVPHHHARRHVRHHHVRHHRPAHHKAHHRPAHHKPPHKHHGNPHR